MARNTVKLLHFITINASGYFEENNENKFLRIVSADRRRDKQKEYEKAWGKIKDFIRSINNNSDNCHKKYNKIKLKKTLEFYCVKMFLAPFSMTVTNAAPKLLL